MAEAWFEPADRVALRLPRAALRDPRRLHVVVERAARRGPEAGGAQPPSAARAAAGAARPDPRTRRHEARDEPRHRPPPDEALLPRLSRARRVLARGRLLVRLER